MTSPTSKGEDHYFMEKKRKLERLILIEVHWKRRVQGGGSFLLAELLGSRFFLRDTMYIFTTGACH